MCDGENLATITALQLLGSQRRHSLKTIFFCLSLVSYYVTVHGHLLITALVPSGHQLHSPIYVFLRSLSTSDMIHTPSIVPNMLHVTGRGGGSISVIDNISRFYLYRTLSGEERSLLTVMSYDRYVDISDIRPWVLGFLTPWIAVIFIYKYQALFWGSMIIHYYCDIVPLLNFSFPNTWVVEMETIMAYVPWMLLSYIFIVACYLPVILTVPRIPFSSVTQTFSSPGLSPLTVVSIFYGTMIAEFVVPPNKDSL
ncbi:olfactory receptor 11L1-like [Ascaphus truei]|uniref:olfactory receptor 11L1-like n=1 Tax=Ascaphus truei TaxID=8439 RepID=UPI003F5920C8